MSQILTPLQQSVMQKALYDLEELGRELAALGVSLVVNTHPLPASDRFTAELHGKAVERLTWSRP